MNTDQNLSNINDSTASYPEEPIPPYAQKQDPKPQAQAKIISGFEYFTQKEQNIHSF